MSERQKMTEAEVRAILDTPRESEHTADDHRSDLLLLVGRRVTRLIDHYRVRAPQSGSE
jgi:hypothetical protein